MFDQFLRGDSLEECYDAVAAVANRWLDMLDTRVGVGGAWQGSEALHGLLDWGGAWGLVD